MSQRYAYLEAVNPDDGKLYTVKLNHRRMQQMTRRGIGAVLEMAHVVPEVLTNPKAIFEGLRRDEDEKYDNDYSIGWLCYVGIPSLAYCSDGREVESWENEMFLVYINDEKVVYNWRWEKAVVDDIDVWSQGPQRRFEKRVL